MNIFSVFKKSTVVVRLVCTSLLVLPLAMSFGPTEAASAQQQPQIVLGGQSQYTASEQNCVNAYGKLEEANKKFAEACHNEAKCIAEAKQCAESEDLAGERDLSGDSGETDAERCADLEEFACRAPGGTSSRDAEKERHNARQDRRELIKQRDELNKQMLENQNNQIKAQQESEDKQIQSDREYQDNRKAELDKLTKQLSEANKTKMKAMQEARQKYDELDQAYIKMRAEIRTLTTNATQAELQWRVDCTAKADEVARTEEKALDQAQAVEDQKLRNYNATDLSGSANRKKKVKRIKVTNLYNQFLNRCLRGTNPDGAAYKLKLQEAKNNLYNAQQGAIDQAGRLEKLRKELVDSMAELEKSLTEEQKTLFTQVQDSVNKMDQRYNEDKARYAQRQQQQAMQQMQQQAQQMQQLSNLNNEIRDAGKEERVATMRLRCSRAGGSSSGGSSTSLSPTMALSLQKLKVQACQTTQSMCESTGNQGKMKKAADKMCTAEYRSYDRMEDAAGPVEAAAEGSQSAENNVQAQRGGQTPTAVGGSGSTTTPGGTSSITPTAGANGTRPSTTRGSGTVR